LHEAKGSRPACVQTKEKSVQVCTQAGQGTERLCRKLWGVGARREEEEKKKRVIA